MSADITTEALHQLPWPLRYIHFIGESSATNAVSRKKRRAKNEQFTH